MDSLAALFIVVFQLFFGWCVDGDRPAPAPAPAEESAGR
jgi:hypothetical protein